MKKKKIRCPFCGRSYVATLDPYGWWNLRKHKTRSQIVGKELLIHNRSQTCKGSHMGFKEKGRITYVIKLRNGLIN
jgi:hypothetical protein